MSSTFTHRFTPDPETIRKHLSLTAEDPEPPHGSVVRTVGGVRWLHFDQHPDGSGVWACVDLGAEPESWAKIAGSYGPVTLESS